MNNCEDCGKNSLKTLTLLKTSNSKGEHSYDERRLCNECLESAIDADLILKDEQELEDWLLSHDLDEILDDSDSFYLVGC